jgi:S-adenosylmethionine:tRNA ribosyltransferase-isomerase
MEPAMRVDDFDYHLPEELIALRPARPRRAARMLVARGAETLDSVAERLAAFLDPGDLLIFNDTRVIPARLFGERRRATGDGTGVAKVEALLIRQTGRDAWRALARPGKRLAAGDRLRFGALEAEIVEKGEAGEVSLRFDRGGPALDRAIAEVGSTPLPPYIAAKRAADAADAEDYQTIFADKPGSVAAPTASLHFDDVLLESLAAKGVKRAEVTLHVGAGTFLPVKAEQVADHRMHAEWGRLDADAAAAVNAARAAGKRVIPVGTTALRLLESAAGEDGVAPFIGETEIFITPGYRFRAADGLMTNFHLPKSTLMMLVSALMGPERIRALYAHAIRERYRFYSYGDASLLLP